MLKKFFSIFTHKEVRGRIIFTLGILLIFKLGSTITVPKVDISKLVINSGDIFGLMNILGGGALEKFSIFALGVSPYITASIVISLLSMGVLPSLQELSKQGAAGRKKLENATRALTLLLAAIQGYGICVTMESQGMQAQNGVFSFWDYFYIVAVLVAGTFFLMWLADQITQKGVGNGVSMIIFAGIIATIPYQIQAAFNSFVGLEADGGAIFNGMISFAIYLLAYFLMIVFVVFMEKAIRKIPIQYASSTFKVKGGEMSYLPIKLNSAGVIPVIFASSVLTAPPTIMSFLDIPKTNPLYLILSLGQTYQGVPWGLIIYIVLIFVFTFFYANLQIDPKTISENFAKSGAYIPGIRPGIETETYLSRVLNRVTVVGGVFLVVIAALPVALPMFTSLPTVIAFGGTGLIIVVGVILELSGEIEGRMASKEYQGFIG